MDNPSTPEDNRRDLQAMHPEAARQVADAYLLVELGDIVVKDFASFLASEGIFPKREQPGGLFSHAEPETTWDECIAMWMVRRGR